MSLFVLFSFFVNWDIRLSRFGLIMVYPSSLGSIRAMWCHHFSAGTPLETRKCQIIAPWASSKPMTFTQVHKCQLWDGSGVCYRPYIPRVRPLLLTNELAWRLLPRWLAAWHTELCLRWLEREREGVSGRSFLLCHRHTHQSSLEQQKQL